MAPPTISVIAPSTASPGTTVQIVGSGLAGATAVKFGSTDATSFTVIGGTVIRAVVPPGTGTVLVTVVTPGGTSNGRAFTYATTAPAIASIAPTSGPAAGGNTVQLTGSGFTGATAVKFGSTDATSFTVIGGTVIRAVAPAGTGTVLVTVVTPGGTSNGVAYTYAGSTTGGTIASVVPTSGPSTGGNTVQIAGSGLTGATAVKFGSTDATSFTVTSDSTIRAVAPPGTGTVLVTVVTPGGTSNGVAYTYTTVRPTLTNIVPSSGASTGGNTVQLSGSGLTGATAVKFGSTDATSFTVTSDSTIRAVVPAGTGTVLVTVVTPAGTSNGVAYTYAPAPTTTTLTDLPDPSVVGEPVTFTATVAPVPPATGVPTGTVVFAFGDGSTAAVALSGGVATTTHTYTTATGSPIPISATYAPDTNVFAGSTSPAATHTVNISWSALVDQTVPATGTFSLRGVAVASDGTAVYTTWLQSSPTNRQIRKYSTAAPDTLLASFVLPASSVDPVNCPAGREQAKSIATDDRGYVYIGSGDRDIACGGPGDVDRPYVLALDSSLTPVSGKVQTSDAATKDRRIGGAAVRKSGSTYYLYISRESSSGSGAAYIQRFDVTDPANPVLDTTFNGTGTFNLADLPGFSTAGAPRGLTVAPDGTIYLASTDTANFTNGTVYRIASDLASATSVTVLGAMDVALRGGRVYATQYLADNSAIAVLDATTLAPLDTITIPAFPHPNTALDTGYSGIDIASNGMIYLADQIYANVAGQESDRLLVSTPLP
ncbi:IPT/TIG domain-containing protein [Streptomyces shenzhenensis]|uniref:IPT/TIG domain-containing protein n=1 Tax=Streptomyces shenzhenensis TaxID=943815 RepID=UPI001F1E71EE|nr:IPT/TIG domain-containing protein [Streptomyces shenzhenensis]